MVNPKKKAKKTDRVEAFIFTGIGTIPRFWGVNNEYHIGILYPVECEFGLPWANMSCGFDSVVGGGLWFIFRHASENAKNHFRDQIPEVASIKIMLGEFTNLQAKDESICKSFRIFKCFIGSICVDEYYIFRPYLIAEDPNSATTNSPT